MPASFFFTKRYKMNEFTINKCATMLERDRASIARMLRAVPPDAGTDKRPLYRLATVVRAIIAHEGKPDGRRGNGDEARLSAERARLAKEQADRVARQNAIERREVVQVEPIMRFVGVILLAMRERLLGLPGQYAYMLSMQPQEQCFRILDDAVRDKLNELADPRAAAADAIAAGFADIGAELQNIADRDDDADVRDNHAGDHREEQR